MTEALTKSSLKHNIYIYMGFSRLFHCRGLIPGPLCKRGLMGPMGPKGPMGAHGPHGAQGPAGTMGPVHVEFTYH